MEFRAYFTQCTCEDEVKKVYRGLARVHHPDTGGTTERFQILQDEYSYQLRKVGGGERSQSDRSSYEHYDYSDLYKKYYEAKKAQEKYEKKKNGEGLGKIFGFIISAILRNFGVNITFK